MRDAASAEIGLISKLILSEGRIIKLDRRATLYIIITVSRFRFSLRVEFALRIFSLSPELAKSCSLDVVVVLIECLRRRCALSDSRNIN